MDSGTRFHIEGAPTFASVNFDRDDPYYGGMEQYRLRAVVPFVGIASDLGVPGLGVGASLAVPFARGVGEGPDGAGPAKYNLRSGQIRAMYMTAAAAYNVNDTFSFGAGLIYVRSTWAAHLHTEALTRLYDTMVLKDIVPSYDDSMIEDPDYGAELEFDELSDNRFTFNVGFQVAPNEKLKFSMAYTHGAKVTNKGTGEIRMGCPPQSDVEGRFGSESFGLCDSTFDANATVSFRLPSRLNGSVVYTPSPNLRFEAMGGWVNWSVYDEFTLRVSDIENLNTLENEETAALLNQERPQARDAHDTFWAGLDVKAQPTKVIGLGGRVLFDQSAIPIASVTPNNFDSNTVIVGSFVSVKPTKRYSLVLGYSQYIVAKRVVTESNFGVTLDPFERNEARYFYPQAKGTYTSSIGRISLAFRGHLGPMGGRENSK